MPIGPFHMGKAGFAINGIAVLFIIFFNVLYCFPYALPVAVASMNYNSVILVGVVILATVWWFVHARRKYTGPKLEGVVGMEEVRERRASSKV